MSGSPPRRLSEAASSRIDEVDDDDLDNVSIASSISSGGDSDGGPAEPEISLFSTSMDNRDVLSSSVAEPAPGEPDEATPASPEEDTVEVTQVFPAGFHRLPSAMRPPVRRGHVRSASAGGPHIAAMMMGAAASANATSVQRNNSVKEASNANATTTNAAATSTARPSVLKKPLAHSKTIAGHHRRVFSHGQITFGGTEAVEIASEMAPKSGGGGHRRTGSKTDFILPPDHEERERKRNSLQREPSAKHRQRQNSGLHRRHDSLAFSFRGHSRQASRTDSIYTIRATPNPRGNTCTDKLMFFFNGCKSKSKTSASEAVDSTWHTGRPEVSEMRTRTVVPNHTIPQDVPRDKHPNGSYTNNHIRTTKYTILTFLPKNLFEQFHRFANLYFLFIVLLNWVPQISAFGKEISMLPVIFVLGVTAIKDIFEDRRRYLSDKRVNNSTCRVYKSAMGRYVKTLWKDVQVGDIVHLSCNEMIPADILVLRSSDEHGLCYIDTQNLDGEANLKQREVPRGYVEGQDKFHPQDFRSSLECDMPTTKIYKFQGTILHSSGERVPIGKDNLLLRECLLKNTDFVEGLVVYAGHESKAMLNNGGPRYKRSKLEVQMNMEVIWCVLTLILLCAIGAIGSSTWLKSFGFDIKVPFLIEDENQDPETEGFLTFWTFVIILQVIIPLSLYVTLEMTKLVQIYLIQQDAKMYDETCDKKVECRALNIPEELGQIQYIFCDKTGTLTENNMVFKRCTIGGQDYSHNSVTTKSRNNLAAEAAGTGSATPTSSTGRAVIPVNSTLSEKLSSMDIQLLIEGRDTKIKMDPKAYQTQDFFLLLAVCNTVIVAKHPHRDTMNASGLICSTNTSNRSSSKLPSQPRINENPDNSYITMSAATDLSEDNHYTRTPSNLSLASSTAPLQPAPSLTPTRSRFGFLSSNPLSPIASSPENSPPDSPTTAASGSRPRHLKLPSLMSRIVHGSSSSKIAQNSSRSPTPTPCELRPIYEAESPDELALVDAAFAYNCKLLKRSPHHAVVSLPSEGLIDFEVLHVLPFDSTRKRMSIILRHPLTKERILYCKGADSAIMPILADPVTRDEENVIETTQQHLNMYAKTGLRVLCMAKRIISDEFYTDWLAQHTEAENSMHRRERLLMESYKRIECKLNLLGATGIEDKLQEGVPDSIHNLREAGIVVWVLTGDKQETAINIAYSCKLFTQNMEVIKLNARSRDSAEATIKGHLDIIKAEEADFATHNEKNGMRLSDRRQNRALVVDGKTLVYILDKRANLQLPFLELTSKCSAVLGCRATPLQKAYIVKIVKEELKMHTLAIGDGANDVSMIQTADVGVGISGQEGMQAVMASDFAITRFKYLERLLLVHGHWNYDRLSRMVLYFFYKNAAFVFVCFWYQIFCGFSGAVMIDQMYLMMFNLLWTSLPPMALGTLDQDAPDTVLSAHPKLYTQGRLGLVYKPYSFWLNMADALYQSIVIFFIAYGTYVSEDVGIWEFGTVICTQCICVMLIHLAIETKSWNIIHMMSLMLSVFLYFAFLLVYNGFCITCYGLQNPFWVIMHTMGTTHFWLVCTLTSFLAITPRLFLKVLKNSIFPDDVSKIMLQYNKSSKLDERLSNAAWSRATSTQSSVLRKSEETTEMTAIMP